MKGIFELEDDGLDFEGENNLLIVDGLNLGFRYKQQSLFDHAAPYMSTVTSLARSYGCNHVIVGSDYGKSTFRKEVSNGEYKANREVMRANQTEEEAEKFKKFLEGFDKALELVATAYHVIKLKNVEMDDIAAYIVKKYGKHFDNIWLISSDKDWDLLLKPNVHRFSYVTRKEYTLDNFSECHDGCETPEDYVSMKVFAGDSGDNVAGFPGVGAKRAYNLIREYGSALDVYDAIPLVGTQKYVQSVNADPDKIIKNYELMDLLSYCEEAINHPDSNNTKEIDKIMGDILNEFD